MIIVGLVLAALAALIHVFIFWMESFTWTSQRTRNTFSLTEAEAQATKEMAFNQGFYNLFLAIITGLGIAIYTTTSTAAGTALLFAGTASMALAAIILFVTNPGKRGAAVKQGAFPLLAVVALAIGLTF